MPSSATPGPGAPEGPVAGPSGGRRAVPAPLTVAAAVGGLEGVALVGQGLALVPALSDERVALGSTSIVFFLLYGGFLVFCCWRLRQLRSWARAPVVTAQLVQLAVAVSFWGGSTTTVAVTLLVAAAVVLGGIFHPASIEALAED